MLLNKKQLFFRGLFRSRKILSWLKKICWILFFLLCMIKLYVLFPISSTAFFTNISQKRPQALRLFGSLRHFSIGLYRNFRQLQGSCPPPPDFFRHFVQIRRLPLPEHASFRPIPPTAQKQGAPQERPVSCLQESIIFRLDLEIGLGMLAHRAHGRRALGDLHVAAVAAEPHH